jgi:DDE superfamily endonuclease
LIIFGFVSQNLKTQAVAVAFSMAWKLAGVEDRSLEAGGQDNAAARDRLAAFCGELYRCLTRRGDVLFELADAVLCGQGRVQMLAELSLEPEHQRGHGALYDALNCGSVQIARLRWALAAAPLPRWDDGRIRLAVDVSNWLRPDAVTSPGRSFCHCYGRGKNSAQMIPGWPYSFIAALEPGRTSWVRLLDAIRLGPDADLAAVTAAQVREAVGRIIAAGHWHHGDPDILVIFDAGYEPARLAWLLRDLPVQVLGRLGTNRVLRQAPPPRQPGQMGRPVRHGRELKLSDDAACPGPDVHTTTQTSRYGAADARAWHRMHPKLKARGAWEGHQGDLPVIEGTLIQLTVDHLPHDRHPKPVWLWTFRPDADPAEVNRCWQAFLRRFDIEHAFRFLKQALGWTRPRLRDPTLSVAYLDLRFRTRREPRLKFQPI